MKQNYFWISFSKRYYFFVIAIWESIFASIKGFVNFKVDVIYNNVVDIKFHQ